MFHRLAHILLLLLVASSSQSQNFIYKHYDLQDGLANPTIHAIFQDKDGFLWIGTESGLCRYDGSRFKTFTVKDGLPGNDVLGIYQDRKGRIWLQFYKNAIAYIYNGKIHNQQNDSLLKKIDLTYRLHGLTEDNEGNIGFCDLRNVFILPHNSNTLKTISTSQPINGERIVAVSIYTDNKGDLIVCSSHSLFKVENDKLKYIRTLSPSQELSQNSFLIHRNYFTYAYTNSIYLRDTVVTVVSDKKSLIKFSPVSDSILSINTTDGAYLFYLKDYRVVKILPGVKVSNIYMDRERNIWIGTVSGGLYKMSSQAIVNKEISDGQNDIWCIAKEKDKVIVGNNTGRIYEYANNRFINRPINKQWIYSYWKVFYHEKLTSTKNLVAHSMGIILYEKGTEQHLLAASMLKQVSPFDEAHVMLSAHVGLIIVRKKDLAVIDTITKQKAISALRTGDSVLLGTTAGLYILKEDSNRRYYILDSLLPASNIGFIKKTAGNLIWVCTFEDGLYCIGNGKILKHFTEKSGLPSDNGRSLYIHNNDIWFGTDKGLVKITFDNGDFHLKKYSTSDGLPSNIINSIYVDNSVIYLGTPEGLCYFNETMIETTSFCNLVLTSVSIGDSLVDSRDKYFLRPNQRFSIEFSGISLRSEQEMTYRYKINGLDDSWRNTNLNVLEFTALPYGDYELEIRAINKFGKESAALKVMFHVDRPFYKTPWFITLMTLLPALLLLLIYNRRMNLAKQKQLQKLQQEIKIIKLEQMALRAQMNPHFIFNCISTIQQLVAEKDTRNASQFITSFSDLVRQTLDNAPELFIPLAEEIRFLTNYFELERIRLEDRFSYKINTAGLTNIEYQQIPNMVIQPFIENAIRHGIRYKKNGKGFIEVIFKQQEGLLRCVVTDNGIGREKAGQMRKESGVQHVSKGMGITFKRIESLNALTNGKINIVVEDLHDKNGSAAGTRVVIDFNKINDYHDKDSNY